MARSPDYLIPGDMDEALARLARAAAAGEEIRILAGGTALVPQIRQGRAAPRSILSLRKLDELREVRVAGGQLRVGSLVTIDRLIAAPLVARQAPLLALAGSKLGGPQIRFMATAGGNLCHAAPHADLAAPLLALEATLHARSAAGRREIPMAEFYSGPGRTVLRPDEILTEIGIPLAAGQWPAVYHKLTLRRAMGIGIVNVAVALSLRRGRCQAAHIALSAAGPVPFRAAEAEAALRGRALSEATIDAAATAAGEACQPVDDVRASAWYRRRMAAVLTRRALMDLRGGDG